MTAIAKRSFDAPDESRTPAKSRIDVVDLGTMKAGRFTMEPGWRWSECIRPLVGTETCQVRHVGAVVSGRMHVAHNDGVEVELQAGDAYVIEPGHDAWVVGDEQFRGFEFESKAAETYAR